MTVSLFISEISGRKRLQAQKGMKRQKMQKLEQLYEGKAKKVFRTDDPELYIVDYEDDATAFNGQKKGTIASKGRRK